MKAYNDSHWLLLQDANSCGLLITKIFFLKLGTQYSFRDIKERGKSPIPWVDVGFYFPQFSSVRHSLAFLLEKLNGVCFRLLLLTIFNQLRSIYNVLCTVLSTQETNAEGKDMKLVNDTLTEIFLGRARSVHKKPLLGKHFFIFLHLFHSFSYSFTKNLLKHMIH